MCLYPKFILNRKYLPNQKNGGNVPQMTDPRTKYVPVGCGKCIECRNQRGRAWSVRLQEEIRTNNNGQFVTLSFTDDDLNKLDEEVQRINKNQLEQINKETGKKTKYIEIKGYELENSIATLAIRRFLERWTRQRKNII